MMSLASIVFVISLLCDLSLAYPRTGGKHFATVTIDIRDVSDTSAVMDWTIPKGGRLVDSYMVSCVEVASKSKKNSVLEYFASKDASHLVLKDLKPGTNYSCSLLVADKNTGKDWTRVMEPIQFTTLNTKQGSEPHDKHTGDSSFVSFTRQNMALLLTAILLPVFVFILCIGGCIIWRKVKAFKKDEDEHGYKRLHGGSQRRPGPRHDLNGQLQRYPPRDTQKMADLIRAKYQLPETTQPQSPSPLTLTTTPPQHNTDMLHSPRARFNEKLLSPNQFDQGLMKIGDMVCAEKSIVVEEQPFFVHHNPATDDNQMCCTSNSESKINLPSLISTGALSASALSSLASMERSFQLKGDLPEWSKLSASDLCHLQTHITLDDILPPIPPPSEEDLVV